MTVVGSGEVHARGVDEERFGVHIVGSGDVEVSGTTGLLSVAITGTGDAPATARRAWALGTGSIDSNHPQHRGHANKQAYA